jgi:hypothetical protein
MLALLGMLCTCDASFTHGRDLTGETRPKQTATSMT